MSSSIHNALAAKRRKQQYNKNKIQKADVHNDKKKKYAMKSSTDNNIISNFQQKEYLSLLNINASQNLEFNSKCMEMTNTVNQKTRVITKQAQTIKNLRISQTHLRNNKEKIQNNQFISLHHSVNSIFDHVNHLFDNLKINNVSKQSISKLKQSLIKLNKVYSQIDLQFPLLCQIRKTSANNSIVTNRNNANNGNNSTNNTNNNNAKNIQYKWSQSKQVRMIASLNCVMNWMCKGSNIDYAIFQNSYFNHNKSIIFKLFGIDEMFTVCETNRLIKTASLSKNQTRIIRSMLRKKYNKMIFASENKIRQIQQDYNCTDGEICVPYLEYNNVKGNKKQFGNISIFVNNIIEVYERIISVKIMDNEFEISDICNNIFHLLFGGDGSNSGYADTIGAFAWSNAFNKQNSGFSLFTENNVKDCENNIYAMYECNNYKENLRKLLTQPTTLFIELYNINDANIIESYFSETLIIGYELSAQLYWDKKRLEFFEKNPDLKGKPMKIDIVDNEDSMYTFVI